MSKYEQHEVAFIFDWNKRTNEFSVYRITKELISTEPNHIERYVKYCKESGELRDHIDMYSWCPKNITLKSGRWHWKGTITFSIDYWGEADEVWECESLTRIG